MKYGARILATVLYSISVFANAQSMDTSQDPLPGVHTYEKTMRLVPGSSAACEKVLGDVKVQGDFSYYLLPSILQGDGYAHLHSLSGGLPPVNAELSQQGDSDRYGFAHYYLPPMTLISDHKRAVGLRGVIFNVCMDQDHSTQAGVMLTLLPTNETCILATSTWNFCRL